MREKVILQDFTVLIVCPSIKWSTIERRALFDSHYLRDIGGNPVILCLKGSQVDIEAEKEAIPRIHLGNGKTKKRIGFKFILELRGILLEKRFDIVHCYDLPSLWISSFLLKSNQKISLFFTMSHFVQAVEKGVVAKWLLQRIDRIFTLSGEMKEYVNENFFFPRKKIQDLGCGIEIYKKLDVESSKVETLGCVINNFNELNRIHSIVKIFRVLKTRNAEEFANLKFSIFLGPRIYQKNKAKKILKGLDYEFYEGDIFLYSLEDKSRELKLVDVFIGVAFDEPFTDYEISSLISETPVLFPRTASRQDLLFKYPGTGESYSKDDIREAQAKLAKIIRKFKTYKASLKSQQLKMVNSHGIETYSEKLKHAYEVNFAKRERFINHNNK